MSRAVPGAERILRRKDGRWYTVVTLPDGKRQWIYGHTRKEVQEKRARLLEEIGLGLVPSDETLGQYLRRWLKDTVSRYNRPGTHAHYETAVRLYIEPRLGSLPLREVGSPHVEAWVGRMDDAGLSPQRIGYARQVLSVALNKAVRDNLIARNPVPGTKAPSLPPPRRMALTPEEWADFERTIRGHRLEALYVLAVTTGLRVSEALGLRWVDLDLGGRTLLVSKQLLYVRGGGHILTEPKTQSGRRLVVLPALAVEALRNHWVRQTRERASAGPMWDGSWGLVFSTPEGRPIYSNTVAALTRRLAERAGVPRMRFHDLRHTYANLLLAHQAVGMKAVSELLGHASSSFTLAVYGHALLSERRSAAEVIDSSLG